MKNKNQQIVLIFIFCSNCLIFK